VLVKTFGSAVYGIEAITITVEVNIAAGTKYFIVGLPDIAVKESYFRIESALKNCGFRMPRQQVVVNMAPADIKKEGSSYDLTIATAVLAASGQMESENLDKYLIMGELSLDGGLQPIKGALPIAIQARKDGFKGFILPKQNAREAAIVNDLEVYGVESIKEVAGFFNGDTELNREIVNTREEFYDYLIQIRCLYLNPRLFWLASRFVTQYIKMLRHRIDVPPVGIVKLFFFYYRIFNQIIIKIPFSRLLRFR
jgi:magnesium chelatase family protein